MIKRGRRSIALLILDISLFTVIIRAKEAVPPGGGEDSRILSDGAIEAASGAPSISSSFGI